MSTSSGDDGSGSALAAAMAGLDTRYRTLGEMVYESIKSAILTGALAPGERLRQESLAASLQVSRIPVRSALLQLDAEGLVSFRSGRGAVVRSLTVEQVREIYELREVLEVRALRKSMATMTPERLARVADLAVHADENRQGSDFVESRTAFYRALYDAEHQPGLMKILEELRGTVGRYLLGVRVSDRDGDQHQRLAQLVAKGDSDQAAEWLAHHLRSVGSSLEQMLEDSTSDVVTTSGAPLAAMTSLADPHQPTARKDRR
ncbi:MAG: GntR family transcriptional regulator [Nocardioides sp.]